MKRGEIRWYEFQPPDKRRPVLILTRDSILEYLDEVTIAPITSTIRDIPSEVIVSPQDGLKRKSAINCDHIQTVSKNRIGPLLTVIPRQKLRDVGDAVNFALNLYN